MLSALLLFAAAVTSQDRVERFPIKHLPADTAYSRLKDAPNTIAGLRRVTYDPTSNSLIVQGTPEAIREFGELFASIDFQSNSIYVAVKNVSAKYLHDLLMNSMATSAQGRSWIPKNVTLQVDGGTNSIIVNGPDAGIREMEHLIPQFDIMPTTVNLDVRGAIPAMKRTISSSGDAANNSLWTYNDESADLRLVVRSRVNGDRSVTLTVSGTAMGSSIQTSIRLKAGQTCYFKFGAANSAGVHTDYFIRDKRIDEDAFLKGVPVGSLVAALKGDSSPAAFGELRLIVRASVKQ